jgi:hypothetical protein
MSYGNIDKKTPFMQFYDNDIWAYDTYLQAQAKLAYLPLGPLGLTDTTNTIAVDIAISIAVIVAIAVDAVDIVDIVAVAPCIECIGCTPLHCLRQNLLPREHDAQ